MTARNMDTYISSLADDIATAELTAQGSTPQVRRKMRTVVKSCGWKARSQPRMSDLHDALENEGIYAFPEVTDPKITMDTFVTFSRTNRVARPLGKIFKDEAGIQTFIQKYYRDVFRGHSELEELILVGPEYKLQSGDRPLKADLVFKTPDHTATVFEFKRDEPELKAPAQLRDYMEALLSDFDTVRGVLVTAMPSSESLERLIRREIAAQQDDFPIDWYWYSVEVDLRPA